MADRIRISADELKAKWMGAHSSGMIHDHQTREVVVVMNDGTEFACSFEDHSAALR